MPSESHHSGSAPLLGGSADGRVTGLALETLSTGLFGRSIGRLVSDSFRYLSSERQHLSRTNPLSLGRVLHAMPLVNWYNVQLSDGGGRIGCCLLHQESSTIPLGVRTGSPIPPNSNVLVFKPLGTTYGIILGVIPADVQSGTVWRPGYLVQGGAAGFHRSQAHMFPVRSMHAEGGVRDFGCGSPVDATSLEWTKVSATGIGILIDDFQAFLRVNEACGVFFNLFDSYTKLCGVNFDIWGACFELYSRLDEGENRYEQRVSTYPWESMGYYDTMHPLGERNDPKTVMYSGTKAVVDTPDSERTIQGIYRVNSIQGYLGQGGLRYVMKPARDAGVRRREDTETDTGLFMEAIGIDGSYMLRSAKSIMIVKRIKIPIPKEVRLPEDPRGDSISRNNYKFSGRYGGGDLHKVGDVKLPIGPARSMLRASVIDDLLSHAFNWKVLHPFHYHKEDFKLDQERESGSSFGLSSVQENLNFTTGPGGYMADPSPVMLHVDHRYSSVEYYMRESYFVLHDDGAVSLGCGYGAEIVMANGKLRLTAPADIEILPGGRLVMIGRQTIIKSEESIDITTSKGDMRLSAARPESNMQFCAGNMLFDAKSENDAYLFHERIGEDVISTGIVFKAKTTVALLGKKIYIRSDVGDSPGIGNIVFDAGVKDADINLYANRVIGFCKTGIYFWHGDRDATPEQTHEFTRTSTVLSTQTLIGGSLVVVSPSGGTANILCDGSIAAGENIECCGGMADKTTAPFIGKIDDPSIAEIKDICQQSRDSIHKAITAGDPLEEALFDDQWYNTGRIGNQQTIKDVGFSFRDDDAGRQYRVAGDFRFFETRWQRMARLGQATGGRPFVETPVAYQGRLLYPWPGRAAWLERQVFYGIERNELWLGNFAADRPGQYENAQLTDWQKMTFADGYKVTE